MGRPSGIGKILFWSLSPIWAAGILMWLTLVLTWYVVTFPYHVYKAIKQGA